MAIWREEVVEALRTIGGQGSLEEIYRAVRGRGTRALPATWQAIVRRELEYNSSDSRSYQHRFDLFFSVSGIGAGVWGLRELERDTPLASDLTPPDRTLTEVYRILRDTQLARRIKTLHSNRCQLCGTALGLADGTDYSEAHHIRPLGAPHNGPDVATNIIVLCPNHHALLDYGAIGLEQSAISVVDGHMIGQEFIAYHNVTIGPEKRP
ncbi:HNH endonuclease [Mesorhizobium sp. URHB0026]